MCSSSFIIRLPNTVNGNRIYKRLLKKHKYPRIPIKPWLFSQKYLCRVYRGPRIHPHTNRTLKAQGHHFDVYLYTKTIYIPHKDARQTAYDLLQQLNIACQNISSQLIKIQESRHNLHKFINENFSH